MTSKKQHTAEPWKVGDATTYGRLVEADGWPIAETSPDGNQDFDANAARIVDCVNACAGMDAPAAEIAQMKAAISALGEQRRQLEDARAKLKAENAALWQFISGCKLTATAKQALAKVRP